MRKICSVLLPQTGQYFDCIGMMVIDAETGAISTSLLTPEEMAALSRAYGCTVQDFVACNSGLIRNPDLIYVDWEPIIPRR